MNKICYKLNEREKERLRENDFSRTASHLPFRNLASILTLYYGQQQQQKSGNWGLDKIDCHCSHKGQCTFKKILFFIFKKLKKELLKKKFKKQI